MALRKERTAQEYTRVLRSSLEEAERLSRLAGDLLTLTRSEAGAQQLQLKEDDLADRVRNALERFKQQAEEKDFEVQGPTSPGVLLNMDVDLMDRVIWNLLDNALKFTPSGGKVKASVVETDGTTVLEVSDTGPGIPEDTLDQVFQRFFRIDEARTSEVEPGGTGLGLAIVRAIVELHGGTVSAANGPEGGSVFRVFIPCCGIVKNPS